MRADYSEVVPIAACTAVALPDPACQHRRFINPLPYPAICLYAGPPRLRDVANRSHRRGGGSGFTVLIKIGGQY